MPDRPRKWWLAVLLTFFTVGLGQLYNGQWRKALVLFATPLALLAVGAPPLRTRSFMAWGIFIILVAALILLGAAVDAFVHARRQRHTYLLQPFNRVAVYLAALVGVGIVTEGCKQIIRTNVVKAYRMPSQSMKPTLEIGDFFFVDMSPSARRPSRGELIVHRYPLDPSKDFVKRVVAIGGDTVEVRNKELYVNGVKQLEPYVVHVDPNTRPERYDDRDFFGPITVRPHELFVMGDNRDNSNDSRYFGAIREQLVLGKVRGLYWSWDGASNQVRWERMGKIVR